ncbi:MAG: acyltransferase [Planctomycetota bacterium]|nr:MAG: acyltransferase [Planctomycetota bacterium]
MNDHPSLPKTLGNLFASLKASLWRMRYNMAIGALGRDRAFQAISQRLAGLPGIGGEYVRRAFYRKVFPRMGDDVVISYGTIFSHPTVSLGESVYIGAYCVIGDVSIGDETLIASGVSIINGGKQHGIRRIDIPIREQPGEFVKLKIGGDCWIGERAVIMANVGDHSVVAAGAVVTRPVPSWAVVAGVPARIIADRRDIAET